ncbi:AzlD family protein [Acinetobacter sp. WZC-1]|uniref:AzlD family protein n=1 Tax=Acinetobacter sp. WZC-1 TaxID=3459034 RepID=UPI00403E278C
MIHSATLIAIIAIAATTYLTRIMGYLLLKNRNLKPRTRRILEVMPGCVLISVIAPYFVTDDPANLIAIIITLLAAIYLPLLPTVLISISSAGLLRFLL